MAFLRKKHPINWTGTYVAPAYYRIQKEWDSESKDEYHVLKIDVLPEDKSEVVDTIMMLVPKESVPKPTLKLLYEHLKTRVEFKISEDA